jgi:2-oxoisovalerate dehydrogenase E1 component alpha subunit
VTEPGVQNGNADLQGIETAMLVLDSSGSVVGDRYPEKLTAEQHVAMLTAMRVARRLDAEFVNLQRQGQLALYPSCLGQEGAQVGAATALRSTDWLFPQYRELGALLVRGIPPEALGQMWRGACYGGVDVTDYCVAPVNISIGTHALHAAGYAMGIHLDGDDDVAVAFIGDGSMSEGDVHEALNMAAVFRTPCIFFVQNNQWAISVPAQHQTHSETIAQKAFGYGMPGIRCDGNDVLACFVAMGEAVERARTGGGPTLIEAVTYRMGAHTTSDDPTRYRSDEELAAWAERDPIARYSAHLLGEAIWNDNAEASANSAADEAVRRLRDDVFDAPEPDPLVVFDHVLAQRTDELERQRRQLAREIDNTS